VPVSGKQISHTSVALRSNHLRTTIEHPAYPDNRSTDGRLREQSPDRVDHHQSGGPDILENGGPSAADLVETFFDQSATFNLSGTQTPVLPHATRTEGFKSLTKFHGKNGLQPRLHEDSSQLDGVGAVLLDIESWGLTPGCDKECGSRLPIGA
jgi:hypothetical protein